MSQLNDLKILLENLFNESISSYILYHSDL